jgi:hypothetical protein
MQRKSIAAVVAVVVILFLALTAGLFHLARRAVTKPIDVAREAVKKKEETVDLTAVVTKVRSLSRLETEAMRIVLVSTTRQSYGVVPDRLTGDSIQFLAVGDVIAGVDLSRITEKDVRRGRDGTIVIDLPPPQVLVSRLDNGESRILNRNTGLLRRHDRALEGRIRAAAEKSIVNEAVRKGILPAAGDSAEKKLAAFLHTLGVERVEFRRAGGGAQRL